MALRILSPDTSPAQLFFTDCVNVVSAEMHEDEHLPPVKSEASHPSMSELYSVWHADGRFEARGVKSSRETAATVCNVRAIAAAERMLRCDGCMLRWWMVIVLECLCTEYLYVCDGRKCGGRQGNAEKSQLRKERWWCDVAQCPEGADDLT